MKKKSLFLFLIYLYTLMACKPNMINKNPSLTELPSTQTIVRSIETIVPTPTMIFIPPAPYEGTPLSPQLDTVDDEIIDGINKTKLIIESVEEYYQNNGLYPEDLYMLIPDYLEKIPLTITGEKFQYQLSKSDIYKVYFKVQRSSNENRQVYCGFIRYLLLWECSGVSH